MNSIKKLLLNQGKTGTVEGVPPLTLEQSLGRKLKDYKIYGNSVQESDNLFDRNSIITNLYPNGSVFQTGSVWRGFVFECIPNTTYTLTKIAGQTCYLGTSEEYPQANGVINERINNPTGTSISVTTGENDKYVTAFFYRVSVDTIPYESVLNSIKIFCATPTPELPVEIESVGEKTKNLFDYSTLLNANCIELIDKTNGEFKFIYTYGMPSTYIKAKEKTSYTISYKVKIAKEQNIIISVYYTDGTRSSITADKGIIGEYVSAQGKTLADKTVDYIKFGGAGGLEINTCIKELQIEENSEATEYEPYGYKIPVTIKSENMFEINNYRSKTDGASVADNNIFLNGTTSQVAYIVYRIPASELCDETITFSYDYTTDISSLPYYNIKFYAENGTLITKKDGVKDLSISYYVPTETNYIQLEIYSSSSKLNSRVVISHIKLQKVRGENLLPYPYVTTTKTISGILFTDNGDGSITVNGTATANADFQLTWDWELKKDMLITSGVEGDGQITYEVFVNGYDGTTLHSYKGIRADHDFTANRIFIRIRPGITVNNLTFYPKLRYANVTYEPYQEPIITNIYLDEPLRRVNEYADYIDFENKKVVRKVGVYELDSSLSWTGTGTYEDGTYRVYISGTSTPIVNGKENEALCNYYPVGIYSNRTSPSTGEKIFVGNGNPSSSAMSIQLRISTAKATNVTQFKEYLNSLSTPLTLYNAYATPIEEEIELPKIPTCKGNTVIELDTNINASNMQVKYKRR